MKRRNLVLSVAVSCLVSCFLLSRCNGQKQIDSDAVKSVKVEEDVHLLDDTTSPSCKLTINYSYLKESGENDTIAQRINETAQTVSLGKEYARIAPASAVDSFKNVYIANYRKDVAELYREDIKNGTPKENLPSWYNYEYMLNTQFSDGKEGVLNFTSDTFEYTGGAHPNQWGRWLNFDKNNGRQLGLNDVFLSTAEAPICEMLLKELIEEMAERLENDNIKTVEDLQNEGVLNSTNIYIPENFLLKKGEVSFLYNKYDIAPYALGAIVLSLPYADIEKYMITIN
ncbi:DUF3298 domain-containing protein [Phocaeicola sp.]